MDIEEAKKLLSFHAGRADMEHREWRNGFLMSLRPFQGALVEEYFIEVMECLEVLKGEFSAPLIDKEIIASVVGITCLTRMWSSPEGMLGRNGLLTEEQNRLLLAWIDIMEECLFFLLDGVEDEAFFSYHEYLEDGYEKNLEER